MRRLETRGPTPRNSSPKTRTICWHGRKQPAVPSSSCHHSHPTFLGSTVTDEDAPAYTLLTRRRVARRLETPLQGTSKSVPGFAEEEGGTTIELFGSDSPPLRVRVSFAETWCC
ncbi:hypothetical protein FQA47_012421 [Oryzias melastigma]|uniref:Uncharacterized protein n=1 Tax=Oryzias melastigma TaxID=30732 RepID=A0A834L057_ORYME|nr:hypothetical protein FQA47_012421 [Oryzias melastigma]